MFQRPNPPPSSGWCKTTLHQLFLLIYLHHVLAHSWRWVNGSWWAESEDCCAWPVLLPYHQHTASNKISRLLGKYNIKTIHVLIKKSISTLHSLKDNLGLKTPSNVERCDLVRHRSMNGDRIPVGARFFAHVQTGPGTHPASCTMGTGYFPVVKRPGRGADHPPPPSAKVKNE
jgi:hypothetical protein